MAIGRLHGDFIRAMMRIAGLLACLIVASSVSAAESSNSQPLELHSPAVLRHYGEEEGLPQMDFNMAEKKLHGNTGCNLFNTTITLDPEDVSSITIAPGATTMMACPNMDLETSVLQSMDQVRSVKAGKDENEMLLVDQDGNVLLVLERN